MMEELLGKTLDRYKIMELLGEGGMGAVFRGHDVTLQRDVAIKVMHPHLSRKADFQERFLREARTAARLDHPAIVSVHDFGQAQNMLYIVMEFIPGDNLRTLLKNLRAKQQWIRLDEAVHLMKQVSAALDYAHRSGVLHRDLKPANIMLKPEPVNGLPYRPILTDLGLAKLMEGQGLTQEGTSLGTPPYMSPEQALGAETDGRSDVYSLGILLYELAVGQLPFPIKTLTDAIRYHTKETPPPPSSLYPEIPPALETVILRAIAKSPADRFPDAGGLVRALEGALSEATQVISAPPSAGAGATSLLTLYQSSISQPRGASILKAFDSSPPAAETGDQLQVLSKDQTTRTVAVPPAGLTLGRGDDNDVVLDDTKASRHHARLTFDGQAYRVVDLDSTNGTLLGNAKLLPGVPEVWEPTAALRIGDTWFRLIQSAKPSVSTALFRTDGTAVDPNLIHTSSGEARIGVFLETAQLTVEPGGSVTASLSVMNQSALVDHFRLAVEGLPAAWLPAPPPPVQLMPGTQQALTFVIQPPKNPSSKAGRYPLTFRVASQDDPAQVATVKGTLTVGVFSQFTTELRPQKIRAGRSAALAVHNRGNAQEIFSVAPQDRADELIFSPARAEVQVEAGETGRVNFSSKPKTRKLIGGEKSHNINLQIKNALGEQQSIAGEVVSRAWVPMWVPPLIIFLCILVSSAAWLYSKNQQTAVAQAEIETVTAQAVLDDDGDGLPNFREDEIGTDRKNPDTDGDELSDGEEIRWDTNPLGIDSDGDQILDGIEVHEFSTSPINPDTDGDGLRDNVDPNPLTPQATPQEKPSPTPTITPSPSPTLDLQSTSMARTATQQAVGTLTAQAQTATQRAAGTLTAQAQTQLAQTATQKAILTAAVFDNFEVLYRSVRSDQLGDYNTGLIQPIWLDAYDIGGTPHFNLIFRRDDGTPWVFKHGLSGSQYQDEFDTWTAAGYRPLMVESYIQNNQIRYAAVWIRKSGPSWLAYHNRSYQEHQDEVDRLVQEGYEPISVSAVSIRGELSYTAFWEKRSTNWILKSRLTRTEYQDLWNTYSNQGYRVTYINAYLHNDEVRFSVIWKASSTGATLGRHNLTSAGFQNEYDNQRAVDYRTFVLTGYEVNANHTFAAIWQK